MTLMDVLLFLPVAQLIALGPGPNNFFAMRNGIQSGVLTAVVATTGRVVAFGILIAITATGLGVMLASSVLAFSILKWIGAAYLIYLGIKTWRSHSVSEAEPSVEFKRSKSSFDLSESIRLSGQEFLLAISNPKAILLFTAIFPQFIDPDFPATQQFVVLGTTYLMTEYVASAIYALFGLNISRFVKTSKGTQRINKVTGGLFVGAGMFLANSSQS